MVFAIIVSLLFKKLNNKHDLQPTIQQMKLLNVKKKKCNYELV
jgi:hypothetical protein